jgi:hypothetical protein
MCFPERTLCGVKWFTLTNWTSEFSQPASASGRPNVQIDLASYLDKPLRILGRWRAVHRWVGFASMPVVLDGVPFTARDRM